MTPRTVLDVLPVMQEMIALEMGLAALYRACGERFPSDRDFWVTIQHQEERHAQLIGELAGLVGAHPEEFRIGRMFNVAAVRTILSRISGFEDEIRKGQVPKQRALFVARDIESSVLESDYQGIVTTENVEFRRGMERMAVDTRAHRDLFAAAVARAKA